MNVLEYLPKYTISDYMQWDGNWELIDGHPVAMSPSPVRRHQILGSLIVSEIVNGLRVNQDNCGDCNVVSQLDWHVNDNTVLCPDVAIICSEEENFIINPPILLIEILSPSTALRDKNIKFEIYRQHGVKYYIIADPASKTHQAYILVNGLYQEYKDSSYVIHEDCEISLDVAAIMSSMKD